jgi:hypothetical protein
LGHCEPWPGAVDHKFLAAVFLNCRCCDPLHRPSLTPCNSVSARGVPGAANPIQCFKESVKWQIVRAVP